MELIESDTEKELGRPLWSSPVIGRLAAVFLMAVI